jgi:hypothetical protein
MCSSHSLAMSEPLSLWMEVGDAMIFRSGSGAGRSAGVALAVDIVNSRAEQAHPFSNVFH